MSLPEPGFEAGHAFATSNVTSRYSVLLPVPSDQLPFHDVDTVSLLIHLSASPPAIHAAAIGFRHAAYFRCPYKAAYAIKDRRFDTLLSYVMIYDTFALPPSPVITAS